MRDIPAGDAGASPPDDEAAPQPTDESWPAAADDGAVSQLGRIGVATGILTVAVALGQVVTVVREVFVASQVGTSARLDALLVALVAPTTIAGLLQSGTAAALVAAIAAAEVSEGRSSARRLAGTILTWAVLVALILAALVALLNRQIVALTGPGLSELSRDIAASLVPVVAPLIVLSAVGALIAALCQSAERFRPIAVAAFAGPVVTAALTIGLWPALGVEALAVGMTGGAAASLVIVAVGAIAADVLPRPHLRASRAQVTGFVRHAAPLWASSASLTLNLISDRAVASLLPTGSVSALRYGETVMRAPVSAVGSAWGTVAYPTLVRSAHEARSSLGDVAGSFMRTVIALSMPLSVGAAALAPLIVDVAYVRGAFDEAAARTTSLVVATLAPLFVLSMVQSVVIGAHNARRAGITLLAAGIIHATLNLGLDLALAPVLGVAGIGLSSSLSFLAVLTFLAIVLARREPLFDLRRTASVGARAAIASLVPGVPIGFVAWGVVPSGALGFDLALLIAGATVGLAGFLAMARLLDLREVLDVVAAVRRRLGR